MCGIIGYIGKKQPVNFLLEGLKKLEYRGYDSSGIAIKENENIQIIRSIGRIKDLENKTKNTKLLNGSRRQRIARGSGTSVQEINKFIKSFEMTQKMIKQMKSNKGGLKKMMKGIDENTLKNFKF